MLVSPLNLCNNLHQCFPRIKTNICRQERNLLFQSLPILLLCLVATNLLRLLLFFVNPLRSLSVLFIVESRSATCDFLIFLRNRLIFKWPSYNCNVFRAINKTYYSTCSLKLRCFWKHSHSINFMGNYLYSDSLSSSHIGKNWRLLIKLRVPITQNIIRYPASII